MPDKVGHLLVVAGARDVTGVLRRLEPDLTITTMVATQRLWRVREGRESARLIALDESATTAEWVALARCVHAIQPLQAIGAFGEFDQDRAAAIGVVLGLRFHPVDVITAVYDKALMRRLLRDSGVEEVSSTAVTTLDELREFADTHGFPLILKPKNGFGSRGVVKLSSPAEFTEDLVSATGVAGDPEPTLVVEPYLCGPEISVEAFSEAGVHRVLGITQKLKDENFVELGHVVREPTPQDAPLVEHVPRVLDALGIADGPTHTELILTAAGPRVVETHTRAGGDQIPQLLHAVSGIDMVELAARQVLGQRVLPMLDEMLAAGDRPANAGAIRYLAPPRPGRLVTVESTMEAAAMPFVTGCTVIKEPDDILTFPIRDSLDRVAYCTAVAADGSVAMEAAERAVEALTIVMAES
jgi:biotin carboxylase